MRIAPLLATTLLALPGFAQEVGYQDIDFVNTTGNGSALIPSRVFYPATVAGLNAPAIPQAGGYPTVVFLHGFGFTSAAYPTVGDFWVEAGYVVVMPDTGQSDPQVQYDDAVALWPLLVTATGTVGDPLEGLLDMSRAGLAGHSMGGSNAIQVLANNPGYAAGLFLAAVSQPAQFTDPIDVPVGLIHGLGDTAIPWPQAVSNFNAMTAFTGVKFVYLFGSNGNHLNVAIGGIGTVPAIFDRSSRVQVGFFDAFLKGDPAGLEEVVGPTATSVPELFQLDVDVEATQFWNVGNPIIGQPMRWEVLCEPGPAAAILASNTPGVTPTLYGTLSLGGTIVKPIQKPVGGSHLLTWNMVVPALPVGFQMYFQGIGKNVQGVLTITNPLSITVQ